MNDFKFVNEKYNLQDTINYRLSIQVNPDGFSVLLCDQDARVLKIIHQNTRDFAEILRIFNEDESLDILKRISFKENKILINTTEFSFVPEVIYQKDAEKFFLSHSTEIFEDDLIKSTRIEENNSRLIFKLNKDLQSFIRLFKNSPNVLHLANSILPYIQSKLEGNGTVFYTTESTIYIAYFKDDKLHFFNAFSYKDQSELVFHAINCFKKLGIDSETKNYYYGSLKPESETFRLLCNYLPKLQPFENELGFEIAGELNENYFSNLLESLDCV
ncbi:MAG: DUF3822 family protein [Bacteroidales bacterium]|nr:DUF3822 family protein [Bacteroidales bacterium]MCF8391404.1 DUF3822 family protein [Bacteroidales bacterium]